MDRRVTVIIPTRNRPVDLRRCLLSIRNGDCIGLTEIFIIDDASQVQTTNDVEFPSPIEVRVIRNNIRRGAAQSRNLAAALATGSILAFLDDDARVSPNWFSVVQRELTAKRAAITGPVIGFDSSLIAQARQARYNRRYEQKTDGEVVNFMAGGNSAIWRSDFLAAGGFPVLETMSDSALAEKLLLQNRGCHFIWDLKINHRNGKGVSSAIAQAIRAGSVASSFGRRSLKDELSNLFHRQGTCSLLIYSINTVLHFCFLAGWAWHFLNSLSSIRTQKSKEEKRFEKVSSCPVSPARDPGA